MNRKAVIFESGLLVAFGLSFFMLLVSVALRASWADVGIRSVAGFIGGFFLGICAGVAKTT